MVFHHRYRCYNLLCNGVGMIQIRIHVVGKEDSYHAQSSGENLKQAIANLIDLQNWDSMEKTLRHFGYSEKEIAEDKARGFHYVD